MKSPNEKKQIAKTLIKLLITVIVMGALVFVALIFNIPNPNMLLITGLVVFTSLYGYGAGFICALAMVLYSMYFFSTDHSFIYYNSMGFQKMAMILLSVILNVIFVGKLKQMQSNAKAELIELNDILKKDNNALKEASQTDTLTGVRNRFALQSDEPIYNGHKLFVMILDIDDFKKTNDTYGHVVGDFILNKTGDVLMDVFGKDVCYRYGGDEFLIINSDIEKEKFISLLNDLKTRLSEIYLYNNKIPMHFSSGYVYGKNEAEDGLSHMIKDADKCLYEAKNQGKDRFVGKEFKLSDHIH